MDETGGRKYEQLKQTIINHIRDQTWKPGDRLPAESYFCETYGVSRITVQKAKSELVNEGFLERLEGRKGHFVKPQSSGSLSGLIGVTIDDISIPFAAGILKGIDDRLREDSLHTVICSGDYSIPSVRGFIESVCQRGADGFIFTPIMGSDYATKNRELMRSITDRNIPLVFVDRHLPGTTMSSVSSNNFQASFELVRRMMQEGDERIVLLHGQPCSSTNERIRGYMEAHEAEGRSVVPDLIGAVDDLAWIRNAPEKESVRAGFFDFMEKVHEFDACFCSNYTTFQLLNSYLAKYDTDQLRRLRIGVYDFVPTENLRFPYRLYSIIQQTYRIGWEAANILVRSIRDAESPVVQMTVKSQVYLTDDSA